MKSGEKLHSNTFQSPMAPQRIVLKSNLNYERHDTTSSDARKSFDHSDKHGGTYRETCLGERDVRLPGLLHFSCLRTRSHPQAGSPEIDSQFENHPNKEAPQEDLQQNRAFNPFSEKSKEMICSMGRMEYFEMCEITPNMRLPQLSDSLTERYLYTVHAEHAYDFHTKFENSTVTDTMFYQHPITSSRRDHPMGDATGTLKDRESTIKSMALLGRR